VRRLAFAVAAALLALPLPGSAAGDNVRPIFAAAMPNVPGKTLTAITVEYAPGGKSASHRHAGSAFIFAYVLEGEIRSALEGETPRVYKAGETWTEPPAAHHVVSENASATKPAKLLAIVVADTGDTLTTVDK